MRTRQAEIHHLLAAAHHEGLRLRLLAVEGGILDGLHVICLLVPATHAQKSIIRQWRVGGVE
jgi:hypothetical protein